jgi:hypothetical protein
MTGSPPSRPSRPSPPSRTDFQYTILRVVPRIERGERINVGVVMFCPQQKFVGARMALDPERLRMLDPTLDPTAVQPHLDAIAAVVAGDPTAGPLAELPASERFGWAAAQSSTVIQPSEIHTGLTDDAGRTLAHLFDALVPMRPEPLADFPAPAGPPGAEGVQRPGQG